MIQELIDNDLVDIHFQPVVSLRACKIIGFEALCRAKNLEGEPLAPLSLFRKAKDEEALLQLDRHCRRIAVTKFKGLLEENPEALLFLNIESSILNWESVGSGKILELVKEVGVPPQKVVLEIVESPVVDEDALIQFALLHKKLGFLIAIDDLGAGHSNLIRIAQLMPDIIKIDHQLIHGIQFDHKKKQMVKFLCELSANIGTLVLAEGVESYDEMVEVYGYGGDMCQGFYFAEPEEISKLKLGALKAKLPSCLEHAKEAQIGNLQKSGQRILMFQDLISDIAEIFVDVDRDQLTQALKKIPRDEEGCECVFIVDSKGVQISETVLRTDGAELRNKSLYALAEVGAQHTYKDYYYVPIRSGLKIYTTNPYVSKATGNVCRTIAVLFESKWKEKCLLCVDILE